MWNVKYLEIGAKDINNASFITHKNEVVTQGQMSNNAKKPRGYKFINNLLKISSMKLNTILRTKEYVLLCVDLPKIIFNKLKRVLS